jgi:hypothetical protein
MLISYRYFRRNCSVLQKILPALHHPAFGVAGYPAKLVFGASLIKIAHIRNIIDGFNALKNDLFFRGRRMNTSLEKAIQEAMSELD